jgi:hypothetical protein
MTANEIRGCTNWDTLSILVELAAQVAESNERVRKPRPQTKKTIVSVARRSSASKRFYVERWKTAVEGNMLPEFVPAEGQKPLDDLVLEETTRGTLGTDTDAIIRRIQ